MTGYFLAVFGAVAGTLLLNWAVWPAWSRWREARFARAERSFHWQRERLEAKFVQLGLLGANPNADRWIDCDFDDAVSYARKRLTGRLSAYVGVTIMTASKDTGSFGGVSSADNCRAATAVFYFDNGRWDTDGQAVFNLSPTEVIQFYRRELRLVGREPVGRS